MRDLTVVEIEMVSGAGLAEWFGGVMESIQQWVAQIQAFISPAPHPTPADVPIINGFCQNGVQNVTITQTSYGAELTLVGPSGQLKITPSSGSWSATCFPAGGEQG